MPNDCERTITETSDSISHAQDESYAPGTGSTGNYLDDLNSSLVSSKAFMLTTFDNPFDPFKQFNEWFKFDIEKGYNTCAYLDRIAKTSDEFSDEENNAEINDAIDEIIKYDFLNIYKKVSK